MDSAPIQIIQLGLEIDAYSEMARNVGRMLNTSRDARQRILERANSDLSAKVKRIATQLPMAMAHDREFFKEAGLDYCSKSPGEGCLTVSVADYLLRNRDKINLN